MIGVASAFGGTRRMRGGLGPILLPAVAALVGCTEAADEARAGRARQSLTATDGSTGVADCDSYLDQYETCMQAVVPSDQFKQLQTGIRRQRTAWRTMHDSAFKLTSLAKICREATELARREFPTCSWTGSLCGNGTVNSGEQCDDGNRTAGDGCSATCTTEPRCGDGTVNGSEQCDDGDTTSGDGCSATCTTEATCSDSTKNGSETDVDCGGSCGATCIVGKSCLANTDCTTNLCSGGFCAATSSCTAAMATDLGAPGTVTQVADNACLRVQNGYPTWWGTSRSMQLQTQSGGSYPMPFTWSNSCAGSSGSNSFTAAWQAQTIGPASSQCATVIKLNGTGSGTLGLTYYGS
jgi:cysteine-rich repeat protein